MEVSLRTSRVSGFDCDPSPPLLLSPLAEGASVLLVPSVPDGNDDVGRVQERSRFSMLMDRTKAMRI